MKKKLLFILCSFIFCSIFSQQIPEELHGIWDGKDRYVFFDAIDNENDEIIVCLKEYYGWYIDRTAEPEKYKNNPDRKRNAGTTKDAIPIEVSLNKILLQKNDVICFELKMVYSNHQINYVPLCLYKNNLYSNFYYQSDENKNVYLGNAVSKGILVSEQLIPENIGCLFIDNEKIYDIRYWKSDMEYSEEKASFSLNEMSFEVPKHIVSGNQNYSCVNGRSKKLRNPQLPMNFEKNWFFTEDNSVLIKDSEPYLTLIADKNDFDQLIQLINENNSKRKPEPAALFPHHSINWYLEIIDNIEFNLDYIKKIREKFDTRNRGK